MYKTITSIYMNSNNCNSTCTRIRVTGIQKRRTNKDTEKELYKQYTKRTQIIQILVLLF